MRNGHALEAEVVRVIRRAASRSGWKTISLMPKLFRISRELEGLVGRLESAEEQLSPSKLNRLTRSVHGVRGQFASPVFRVVAMRIERSNMRLADYAEGVFMAGHPEFQTMTTAVLRRGPASELNPRADLDNSRLRSA